MWITSNQLPPGHMLCTCALVTFLAGCTSHVPPPSVAPAMDQAARDPRVNNSESLFQSPQAAPDSEAQSGFEEESELIFLNGKPVLPERITSVEHFPTKPTSEMMAESFTGFDRVVFSIPVRASQMPSRAAPHDVEDRLFVSGQFGSGFTHCVAAVYRPDDSGWIREHAFPVSDRLYVLLEVHHGFSGWSNRVEISHRAGQGWETVATFDSEGNLVARHLARDDRPVDPNDQAEP